MRRITFVSVLIACLATVAVIAPAASARGGGTTRSITLRGSISFPNASGHADYKVGSGERELQIEVEHISVLRGKHVNVFVNGSKLASPLVSSLGQIHVERNTSLGQTVPTIVTGSTVRVRTLGGTLIASGTF
jgi:predicted PilT family ATPase